VAERPPQLTLVFDGTCGFCTRSIRLLKALDRNRRMTAVPFQKSGVPASVGLTLEECKAAAWAIASDGGRYRGAEPVNVVVGAALGSTLPLLLYSLPGMRQLLDFIYYLVASNRSRSPGSKRRRKWSSATVVGMPGQQPSRPRSARAAPRRPPPSRGHEQSWPGTLEADYNRGRGSTSSIVEFLGRAGSMIAVRNGACPSPPTRR
jgi:predicted DCC family thiol-disulfide oxidoreductase YuxK